MDAEVATGFKMSIMDNAAPATCNHKELLSIQSVIGVADKNLLTKFWTQCMDMVRPPNGVSEPAPAFTHVLRTGRIELPVAQLRRHCM